MTSSFATISPPAIPFSRPVRCAAGVDAVAAAAAAGTQKAGGPATARCEEALTRVLDRRVMMTASCTVALELGARLLGLGPGDEVVMPSLGFPSAANAIVLTGATPVFVDVLRSTLNLDPEAVRAALTPRTRAIVVVHYAGVAAPLEELLAIARDAGVDLIEDAAQCVGSTYRGRPLGTFGTFGTLSFDATKNLSAGSGGALIVNDPERFPDLEAFRDYGTDRAAFGRGEIERYSWIRPGTNAAMNELAAAFLAPQLEDLAAITASRTVAWERYADRLEPLERRGLLRRLEVPAGCTSNGHIVGVVLPSRARRDALLEGLEAVGVQAAFHFVPLHSAPAGLQHARAEGRLERTTDLAGRLLRLPIWNGMPTSEVDRVIAAVDAVLSVRGDAT